MGEPTGSSALSKAGEAAAATKTATNGSYTKRETSEWTPSSWTSKPIKQDVVYDDRAAVSKALAKLEHSPPIVTPTEICRLKKSLREVALGKAFLLQGGDCAELFDYCESSMIESKIKLLLQMSLILIYGARKPVVRIARMAGQFAKPRSSPTEQHNGKTIPAFRGDNINGYDPEERTPDPSRLVSAYFHSAATSNYIRASLASGIADLHSPLDWELGHVKDENIKAKYERIVESITESLGFMNIVGAANTSSNALDTVDLYTSHEGLLLEYEQSLTRKLKNPLHIPNPSHPQSSIPISNGTITMDSPAPPEPKEQYYNTSAHFLWIGDRTRQLSGAHVEYFRGIANPIGIKLSSSLPPTDLISLLDTLNPRHEIGKITLITRYGHNHISTHLRTHIRAVQTSPHKGTVVWQCDPMHGNTFSTSTGIKTRRFSDILGEVDQALRIHDQEGSFLGGVHLELTGEPVTECVGGSEGLREEELERGYASYCDPRLNEKQALELAFLVAGFFRGE